jgi:two-component system, cell cycle sensor histidine kinase and response regulator CckA
MNELFNNKILVVSDDSIVLGNISSILSQVGYKVLTNSNENSAIETARFETPDLIISETAFQGFNYCEFRKLLSADETLKNTPFILIADENELPESTVEADDYLAKNFEPVHLVAKTVRLIERGKTREEDNRVSASGFESSQHSQFEESQAQIANILESITDGFFALNSNWIFTYVNSAAERVWQKSRKDLLGKNIWEIFPAAVNTPFFETYRRVMNERITLRFIEYYAPSDSWREVYTFPATDGISVYFQDVTEQKKAAERIRQSEERFRALIENSADGIVLFNSNAGIIDISPSGERILGCSKEEVAGQVRFDLIHPDDAQRVQQFFVEIISKPSAILTNQYRIRHSNGAWLWIESVWSNLLENTSVQAIVVNFRDITERKSAEQELIESREMLHMAMSGSKTGAWSRDLLKNDVKWSEELETIFGLEKGSFSEKVESFYDKVYEEDREYVKQTALKAISEHTNYVSEFRFYHADGSLRWMEGRGKAVYAEDGTPTKVYGIGIDITDRKSAEEAFQQSEERLRSVVEQSVVGITQVDLNGRFINVNDQFCKMVGYSREELLELRMQDVTHPEDAKDSENALSKLVVNGVAAEIVKRYVHRNGSIIWVNASISPIRDSKGRANSAVGIVNDITARKQAEERLRESEARLRLAIEISQTAMFEINLVTDAVETDEIGREIYGFEIDEPLTFRRVQSRFHPDDVDEVLLEVSAALAPEGDDEFEVEQRIIRTNGEIRWIKVRGRAFFEEKDGIKRPVTCLGTYLDITKQKLAAEALLEKEEQLRQAQKLESVGRLAGGIAHDFNNMLTAINGYSELTLRKLDSDNALRGNLEEIKKAGERSAALTQQLLAFSRQQILQPKVLDINEVVQDTSKMLKRLIGENIELRLRLNPRISRIKADPVQLSQVIMNLAVNSRDAMPGGGKITIETDSVFLDGSYLKKDPALITGNYVALKFSDTGSGIDSEIQEHIFEPFFTTKPVGEGTGLGLATVYGIIKQSDGYIWVESEIGQGAAFEIYLPEAKREKPAENDDFFANLQLGTETILLVEDEEIVRTMSKMMLEECGYRVLTAANAEEALSICRQNDCGINLLITDLVMPGMSGRELSEKLSSILPNVKVLFTSGYTDDSIMRDGITETSRNFIQKPFTIEALSEKVRASMDD